MCLSKHVSCNWRSFFFFQSSSGSSSGSGGGSCCCPKRTFLAWNIDISFWFASGHRPRVRSTLLLLCCFSVSSWISLHSASPPPPLNQALLLTTIWSPRKQGRRKLNNASSTRRKMRHALWKRESETADLLLEDYFRPPKI